MNFFLHVTVPALAVLCYGTQSYLSCTYMHAYKENNKSVASASHIKTAPNTWTTCAPSQQKLAWPGWVVSFFVFFALLCVCVCMLMSMCIALSIHTYVRTYVHDDAHVTDIVTCEYYAVCHVNCVYNDNRIIAMPCHTFIHFSKWGDLNCALFEKNVPKESTSYDTRTDGRTVVSSCISKLRT